MAHRVVVDIRSPLSAGEAMQRVSGASFSNAVDWARDFIHPGEAKLFWGRVRNGHISLQLAHAGGGHDSFSPRVRATIADQPGDGCLVTGSIGQWGAPSLLALGVALVFVVIAIALAAEGLWVPALIMLGLLLALAGMMRLLGSSDADDADELERRLRMVLEAEG
jgi:hypothetical protein